MSIMNEIMSDIMSPIMGGDISNPFPPPSNSSAWLDGKDSSTITLTAGRVSTWTDKSGNANNAGQTTGTNQPSYSLNKGVLFGGSDDFMDFADALETIAQNPSTLVIVFQTRTGGTKQRLVNGGASGDTKWGLLREASGKITGFSNISFNEATTTNGVADTDTHVAILRSYGSTYGVSLDNGAEVTGTGASSILDTIKIGATPTGNGEFFNGFMKEITVYNRAITDAEKTERLEYSYNKWKIVDDPVLQLAGIEDAVKASFYNNYTSGNIIDNIQSIGDGDWQQDIAGTSEVKLDMALWGGFGGFVSKTVDDSLETPVLIGQKFGQAGILKTPALPTVNPLIHQLGTTSKSPNNILDIDKDTGHLQYKAANGSTNTITLSTDDWRGITMAFVLNAKGLDDWQLKIWRSDTDTVLTFNFNPNNNYNGRTRCYWCGGDAQYGAMYLKTTDYFLDDGDLTPLEIITEIRKMHNV